jgi:dinuclear metal center YbgI/SA1388 family protein
MLRIGDILSGLFRWAPASLAWERDNIGLLVGSAEDQVERILVCLDVTPEVVREAVERDARCIVAHHPVIFHPLKSLRTDRYPGNMLATLVRENIAVIAMHTNADAARNGLNHALAAALGLNEPRPLDAVRGQRRLLTVHGTLDASLLPRLRGDLAAEPDIHLFSQAAEDGGCTLQLDLPDWLLSRAHEHLVAVFGQSAAMVTTVALDGALPQHGIGMVGMLETPQPVEDFLSCVKQALSCSMLRTTPFTAGRPVQRIAVSSGAGSSYVRAAIAAGADVLVTGDLTHHTFLDYQHDILLVDAGHFETEQLFIRLCEEELARMVFQDKQKIDILRVRTDTNPVRFV